MFEDILSEKELLVFRRGSKFMQMSSTSFPIYTKSYQIILENLQA